MKQDTIVEQGVVCNRFMKRLYLKVVIWGSTEVHDENFGMYSKLVIYTTLHLQVGGAHKRKMDIVENYEPQFVKNAISSRFVGKEHGLKLKISYVLFNL